MAEIYSALDLSPGDIVGGYTLLNRLDQGGMGTIWRVRDDGGNIYAMKILLDSLTEEDESGSFNEADNDQLTARERFRREALALRRIDHPGVNHIVDMELDDALAFIVTELIEGKNLRDDVYTNGRYTAEDLDNLARMLIDAVDAVHAAGIIHRDIKPTNVMISQTGPVLVDFGIAMGENESHVTRTGMVMGTPGFIAPEIIEGAESDEATDWWSVAAVLGFAATGKPIFGSKPLMTVLERAASGNADLFGLPPLTLNAMREALNPDRMQRCSAQELLAAIHTEAQSPEIWDNGPNNMQILDSHTSDKPADRTHEGAGQKSVVPPFSKSFSRDIDATRLVQESSDNSTETVALDLADSSGTQVISHAGGSNPLIDAENTRIMGAPSAQIDSTRVMPSGTSAKSANNAGATPAETTRAETTRIMPNNLTQLQPDIQSTRMLWNETSAQQPDRTHILAPATYGAESAATEPAVPSFTSQSATAQPLPLVASPSAYIAQAATGDTQESDTPPAAPKTVLYKWAWALVIIGLAGYLPLISLLATFCAVMWASVRGSRIQARMNNPNVSGISLGFAFPWHAIKGFVTALWYSIRAAFLLALLNAIILGIISLTNFDVDFGRLPVLCAIINVCAMTIGWFSILARPHHKTVQTGLSARGTGSKLLHYISIGLWLLVMIAISALCLHADAVTWYPFPDLQYWIISTVRSFI
ncbi:protein kinase [Alloscardovia omnicolens]|uniref:protein kinase domain-containing protein n=1 Tax=Alloscardovia omnicolens TaxID=419015 RepID=UPI003A60C907